MGKMILAALCSLQLALTVIPAMAESSEGQSSMKVEDAKDQKNTVSGDADADQILTNNKLRAETGSKSKWSIATQLQYAGATVSRPFSDFRPNINAVNTATTASDIDGGINIKYNLTQRDSLLLGETVRYISPLSSLSKTPSGYRGQKFDNFNPSLTYQRIYKVGGFQSYYQVGPTWYTQTDLPNYVGNISIYNVNAYDVGHTRFTIGLESGAGYNWFKSYQTQLDGDTDYNAFAYPYLEYRINDTFNLRTVTFLLSYEHTLASHADMTTWTKDKVTQSCGVGISITRDVFLYPNLQFIPDQLRGKDTNVALSTNINMF